MPERILQAEAALGVAIRQKLTPLQRLLVRDCPELLRRLAHTSALEPRKFEVAEDVADDAVPRVACRLEQIAEATRREGVAAFFEESKLALYPFCLEVALTLQGKPTDLNNVVDNVRRMFSELPGDKSGGVIWRFGPRKFFSYPCDSADKILALLTAPVKRHRPRGSSQHIEAASRPEMEALAKRWEEHQEPPRRPSSVQRFDISWDRHVKR